MSDHRVHCNVPVYQLFGGYGAGAMALRRHFDHPFPNINGLDPVIACVRVVLIVYWYDTCDRCFTLMM